MSDVPRGGIEPGTALAASEPRVRRGISSITTLSAPSEPINVARSSRDAINRSSSMASALVVSPVGR